MPVFFLPKNVHLLRPLHIFKCFTNYFSHKSKQYKFVSAVSNTSDCRSRGWGLTPAWSHTFVERESWYNFYGPSNDSRRVVVGYKRKYVHKVLVKHLEKLALEKVWQDEHDHSCWLRCKESNPTKEKPWSDCSSGHTVWRLLQVAPGCQYCLQYRLPTYIRKWKKIFVMDAWKRVNYSKVNPV